MTSDPVETRDYFARDTDHDWYVIAQTIPYYGVYTDPRFSDVGTELTDAQESAYFATGITDIGHHVQKGRRCFNLPERFDRAVDFGAGVGRLTRAMIPFCDHVTGVEITADLVARAKVHAPGADYVRRIEDLPEDARYDWINSLVVFQHIPPLRGMEIFEGLLNRAADDCFLSVHFCTRPHTVASDLPRGSMLMFGYDETEVLARMSAHGFVEVSVEYLDHGGNKTLRFFSARGEYVQSDSAEL